MTARMYWQENISVVAFALLALLLITNFAEREEDTSEQEENMLGGSAQVRHSGTALAEIQEKEKTQENLLEATHESVQMKTISSHSKEFKFKVMQFNMLADGLAFDGFLAPRKAPLWKGNEVDDGEKFFDRVKSTMDVTEKAKQEVQRTKGTENEKTLKEAAKERIDKKEADTEKINEKRLVAWDVRGPRIVEMIKKHNPDIITLQEVDQYSYLASALSDTYTSVVPPQGNNSIPESDADDNRYSRARGCSSPNLQDSRLRALNKFCKKFQDFKFPNPRCSVNFLSHDDGTCPHKWVDDDECGFCKEPDPGMYAAYRAQLKVLSTEGVAFAPFLNSNARRLGLSRGWTGHDDQGVAIFWKKNTFTAQKVDITVIGTDAKADAGAVKVTLQHKSTGRKLAVVTTHLSSGPEKELRRHHELEDVRRDLIAGDKNPIIFATDMNSDVWYDKDQTKVDKIDGLKKAIHATCNEIITERGVVSEQIQLADTISKDLKKNMPHGEAKTLTKWDMSSVWSTPSQNKIPTSVLKMRGPATNQPHKMGDLGFETIDYIFYRRDPQLKFVEYEVPSQLAKMTLQKRKHYIQAIEQSDKAMTEEKRQEIETLLYNMLPSPDNPSDHFPVLATFAFAY